ncbi:ABC transporter ATP-binding protein [Streptococcus oriscaviae]|uniref:ABC transporter ATP-binding protein n=1 Tax=Streptococcus oriscaviae TaxID=2781599 RepID=A0ABX7YIP4_9STRE|nr:ABC transporter ATP-binding protein [Streptococcus oriscaviae]QUE53388.1 ABC transporter ATP-binding protein [Streptococcus oriscaviae]
MIDMLKETFALTDRGANDLFKASIASFFVYVSNMLPTFLLMLLVDHFLLGHEKSSWFYLGLSAFILLLLYLILNAEYDLLYNTTYKESANLRIDIAHKLSKLPLSYFSKNDLSDVSQTIMSDVEAIEHAISHSVAKVLAFAVFFPLVSVLLLTGNLLLGLAVVLPIVANFCLLLLSKNLQLRGNKKYFHRLRENSESFQEAIELQQEIKSYGLTEKVRAELYQKMDESERIHLSVELLVGLTTTFSGIVSYLSLAAAIFFGIQLYMSGEVSILYVLGYLLVAMKLKEAADGINGYMAELFYLDARVKRIKEIRKMPVQEGKEVVSEPYDICLQDVTFAYESHTPVLKGVTFTARQNQVTAIVGRSGCGKTSILRLVSRLYDYDGGRILIGGRDIKQLATGSLFSKLSIVFQDVILFNASVLDNIRIGRQDATDEEVKEAARLANCHEFITRLPEGYDTLIGENGASLSGGERQRLSIARAFLKNAPIIILDEISASLDVENEKKIQDSLNQLIKDRTVLVISHRLKSIEKVDQIVVLDDGRVEAVGQHQDLLKSSKLYASLIKNAQQIEQYQY